jgi:hypothetical protein
MGLVDSGCWYVSADFFLDAFFALERGGISLADSYGGMLAFYTI